MLSHSQTQIKLIILKILLLVHLYSENTAVDLPATLYSNSEQDALNNLPKIPPSLVLFNSFSILHH